MIAIDLGQPIASKQNFTKSWQLWVNISYLPLFHNLDFFIFSSNSSGLTYVVPFNASPISFQSKFGSLPTPFLLIYPSSLKVQSTAVLINISETTLPGPVKLPDEV